MVAANYRTHPRGSLVATSLGCANGLAGEHRAVGKRKKGWGEFRLKGG